MPITDNGLFLSKDYTRHGFLSGISAMADNNPVDTETVHRMVGKPLEDIGNKLETAEKFKPNDQSIKTAIEAVVECSNAVNEIVSEEYTGALDSSKVQQKDETEEYASDNQQSGPKMTPTGG